MTELKRILALLLLITLLGASSYIYIQGLSDESAAFALSEQGPFEQLSLIFWLLLSGYIIWRWWPGDHISWTLALLPLIALAREASLHKAVNGISVLKRQFYLSNEIALQPKLLMGAIALTSIAALVYGLYLLVIWLRAGAWKHSGGQFMLIGVGLLIGTKILDRVNSILRTDFGVILAAHTAESIVVFEESLEMALPLVLLAAARFIWLDQQKKWGRR
jgi:hypothetical protein